MSPFIARYIRIVLNLWIKNHQNFQDQDFSITRSLLKLIEIYINISTIFWTPQVMIHVMVTMLNGNPVTPIHITIHDHPDDVSAEPQSAFGIIGWS